MIYNYLKRYLGPIYFDVFIFGLDLKKVTFHGHGQAYWRPNGFSAFFYIDIDSCMVGFESSVHSISVDNNPYAPCMEYLRTFALIRTQM